MNHIPARILILAAVSSAIGTATSRADVLLSESFETDGNGTRYTITDATATPRTEFRTSSIVYFMRANNQQVSGQVLPGTASQDRRYSVNHADSSVYTNFDGSFVFAAENSNSQALSALNVTFNPIATTGYSGLSFTGLFGGTVADDNDFMTVFYSLNGGAFVEALDFRAITSGNTRSFALDTTGDNVGDPGAGDVNLLMPALKSFGFAIPSADTVTIRLTVSSNASADEFGFDRFRVEGVIPEPGTALLAAAGAGALMLRRR